MSFSVSDIAAACGGKFFGPDIPAARAWSCDSREVCEGGGFAAIRGANTDGHLYIKQAAAQGARVVLAEREGLEGAGIRPEDFPGVSFVVTERRTEDALALAASDYLRRVAPKTIAITGSVGKTTTRELTAAALARRYKVHSAVRSFNTIIGCALTVLSMAEDTEALVLELGTNHFGEIAEMVKYFPPETVIITEIAPAHLEGFGSIEGVLRAKLEICGSEKLQKIIFNYDNALLREAMSHNYDNIMKIGVGREAGADILIEECRVALNECGPSTYVRCREAGREITLSAPLFGEQHAYNMCFALAAAESCCVSAQETASGFAAMAQLGGRGLCRRTARGGWVIDEAYNANPASMRAAIRNARAAAESLGLCKCAALGGMRELGASAPKWHREILEAVADFDYVLLLGGEWKECGAPLADNFMLCASLDELVSRALEESTKGGLILVKGSNSYGLKKAVAALTEE